MALCSPLSEVEINIALLSGVEGNVELLSGVEGNVELASVLVELVLNSFLLS